MAGILALDLARDYGWAYFGAAGNYVASGHKEMRPDTTLGRRAYFLKQAICDLIDEYRPAMLAIEKPIHAGSATHFATARALYVYASAADEVAYLRELDFAEYARSHCTKVVMGNGRIKKEEGVDFCRKFKANLQSNDEADAILVALCAISHLNEASK